MKKILTVFLLAITQAAFGEDDNQSIDNIYRLFLTSTPSVEAIEQRYAADIIHVGRVGTPFISGKETFMRTAVEPIVEMIQSGQAKVGGRFLILRRDIGTLLANDVGYFHMSLQIGDNPPVDSFQKFSWVFRKDGDQWKVITDFDATPATEEIVKGATPIRLIE